VTTENTRPPFNESAALEALERLREQIRQARSRREQKVEEFDAWVRATRAASQAERLAALEKPAPAEPIAAGAARAADRATESVHQSAGYAAAPAVRDSDPWRSFESEYAAVSAGKKPPAYLDWTRMRYAAGAAAVIIGALVFTRSWRQGPAGEQPAAPPAARSAPQPSATGSPSAAAGAPRGQLPPAARRPLEIELTTVRPVWMRVIVDGERRVEREVPAGQRLTFGADRAIVLRAGDGGGVRLSVGGRDLGPLGRDGQIAVRTLTPGGAGRR